MTVRARLRCAGASQVPDVAVAVGTPIAERPPHIPYVRLSRIRLLPQVSNGEPLIGPSMEGFGFGSQSSASAFICSPPV